MVGSVCQRAELQPNVTIFMVPEDCSTSLDTSPDAKRDRLRVLWHMRSSQTSPHNMTDLLPNKTSTVSWADVAAWLKRLSQPPSHRMGILEGEYEMQGA